jgi:hypothetical protein
MRPKTRVMDPPPEKKGAVDELGDMDSVVGEEEEDIVVVVVVGVVLVLWEDEDGQIIRQTT